MSTQKDVFCRDCRYAERTENDTVRSDALCNHQKSKYRCVDCVTGDRRVRGPLSCHEMRGMVNISRGAGARWCGIEGSLFEQLEAAENPVLDAFREMMDTKSCPR
jgi:hypothetical protein